MIMDEKQTYPLAQTKQSRNKKLFIKELSTVPVVHIAAQKAGVSRATYYRWRDEDDAFAEECDKALSLSRDVINDLAESQIIAGIKNNDWRAIVYWLAHNHPRYNPRTNPSQEDLHVDAIKVVIVNGEKPTQQKEQK